MKKKVNGKKIRVQGISVPDLMRDAGYRQLSNGSYVYHFKEFYDDRYSYYRYHVYEVEKNLLEIHTDLIKGLKGARYHIASTFTTTAEKKRLQGLMPYVVPKKGKKQYLALKREDRLKALEEMGDPIIRKLKWHERFLSTLKQLTRFYGR